MADPKSTNESQWSLWSRTQKTAVEWLAVIISMLGFLTTTLIAILAAIVAGIALWVASESHDEAEVLGIYVQKLHAELRANGFEPPPLPEEEE